MAVGVGDIRLAREALAARGPHVFDMDCLSRVGHEAEFETYWDFQARGVSAIDGLSEWLQEHCGERGEGWDLHVTLIGIRDPDAAFWFRVTWV